MNLNFARNAFNAFQRKWRYNRASYILGAEWADICTQNDIPIQLVKASDNSELIVQLRHNSIRFPNSYLSKTLLKAFRILEALDSYTGCEIAWDSDCDGLRLNWGGVVYVAKNLEELYILKEIYEDGDYDVIPFGASIVIDVGANVGFTSIFIASNNPCIEVIACEPLEINYRRAKESLALNPKLAKRITLHNFGLFSFDGECEIFTEPDERGRSSIVIDRSLDAKGTVEKRKITVRRASVFVEDISSSFPGKRMILKLDCEGSEYQILRDLRDSGVLHRIDGIVMEWHDLQEGERGVDSLSSLLNTSGFDICMRGRFQTRVPNGMAYAFRANLSGSESRSLPSEQRTE